MSKGTEEYPHWDTNEEWRKNYAPYIRWGLFYYNKKDKRLWVPKYKSKYGTTINMAHPYAIMVIVVILLFIIFIIASPFFIKP